MVRTLHVAESEFEYQYMKLSCICILFTPPTSNAEGMQHIFVARIFSFSSVSSGIFSQNPYFDAFKSAKKSAKLYESKLATKQETAASINRNATVVDFLELFKQGNSFLGTPSELFWHIGK